MVIALVAGSQTVVVELTREVRPAEVEDALQQQGFLEDSIVRVTPIEGGSQVVVQVNLPMRAITAKGIPQTDAVQLLRSLANALELLDR